jgi:hypothetical protein
MVYIPGGNYGSDNYGWAEFTSTQSWTIPNGVKRVYVTLVGGGAGGGGGGSVNSGGAKSPGGGGGGAGKIFYRVPLTVTPGLILDIAIGLGGTGGAGAAAGQGTGGLATSGGNSTILRSSNLILEATGGKAGSVYNYGGASGSGLTGSGEVSSTSNGSFGSFEKVETALGGFIYASSSGGSSGGNSPGTAGYLPAFRALDPILTAALTITGGTCGGGARHNNDAGSPGGGGAIGWILGPSYPAGVSGGDAGSTPGIGGKAPGYGGGGGGGGSGSTTTMLGGNGGNGQPGYCMIEWGF